MTGPYVLIQLAEYVLKARLITENDIEMLPDEVN